jgi:hypothetical protein
MLLGDWCHRNGYAVANGVYYGPNGYYDANLVWYEGGGVHGAVHLHGARRGVYGPHGAKI